MSWSQLEAINKIQEYWKNQYTESLDETSKVPFYNLFEMELKQSRKEFLKRIDDKPLVEIVPEEGTEPVKALLLNKHFAKWEKANRKKINKRVAKLLGIDQHHGEA